MTVRQHVAAEREETFWVNVDGIRYAVARVVGHPGVFEVYVNRDYIETFTGPRARKRAIEATGSIRAYIAMST